MKKIININFQGRIIPIEETAYDILKLYIESLRRYFAKEEGNEEIINDIQSRIAELFSDRLKRMTSCIADEDVNAVISSIGRPEDLEEAEGASETYNNNTAATAMVTGSDDSQQNSRQSNQGSTTGKRLFRSKDDKILGGVAAGVANYFGFDPSLARIAFAFFMFLAGSGFLIYIILWIVLPARSSEPTDRQPGQEGPHRVLFRSKNDKMLGGVAAGLASYFGIDPSIMRILFILCMFLGGLGFILYLILWIILPSRSFVSTIRKRLYRNPENRMLGGVAGGIAAFLNIDVWLPRIIFLAPFILGIFSNIFNSAWLNFNPLPHFFLNGFGGTIFISYIILWIILPEAYTAAEKLEMRGEKVDLESIKKTVQDDLGSQKGRSEKIAGGIQDPNRQFGSGTQNFVAEPEPFVRRSRSGIGQVIGILFKVFFLFIAGIIVFALVMALAAILSTGISSFPFKDFLLGGFWQNFLAWATITLFLGIPIIALLTWLIRRIIGAKSGHHYLGYTFGSLWFVGLVCTIILITSIARNFRSKASIKEDISVVQPANNKLLIKVNEGRTKYYSGDWFGFDNEFPFFSKNNDSIMMNTVRVRLIKSNDTFYHAYAVKFSNGNNPLIAESLANSINFNVSQTDSILYLPKGFTITQHDKFRNQQVMVVAEIPVGKRIEIDRTVDQYSGFNINFNRRRGWNIGWDERWDNAYYYNSNREYIMTSEGLDEINNERVKLNERFRKRINEKIREINDERDGGYRYKGNRIRNNKAKQKKDTVVDVPKLISKLQLQKPSTKAGETNESQSIHSETPVMFNLLTIFQ